jgi:hypothetical protein
MNNQISAWIAVGMFLGIIIVLFILFQGIKRLWNFLTLTLPFRNLRINTISRTSDNGIPQVMIKLIYSGKKDIVIEDVDIKAKLSFLRKFDGFLAWLQLGFAYFTDDVESLNIMLGKSSNSIVWIPNARVHKINQPYIRKPLSVIFGVITIWYFLIFFLPPFWPCLFVGPYWAMNIKANNEKVKLTKKENGMVLNRPLRVKHGIDNVLTIEYKPSLYFLNMSLMKKAKIYFEKVIPESRYTILFRNNSLKWKVNDDINIKVKGKIRRYSVTLGMGYINVRL